MHPQDTIPLEEWRPVVSWESWYSVSDQGHVRRDRGGKGIVTGRILKPTPCPGGYLMVSLSRGGVRTALMVHQLVAAAFLGARPNGQQINHVDGVKCHNGVANLEYVTPSGNHQHAQRLGLRADGERHGNARLTDAVVRAIRGLHAQGQWTHTALACRFGVSRGTISNVLRGRGWRHVL